MAAKKKATSPKKTTSRPTERKTVTRAAGAGGAAKKTPDSKAPAAQLPQAAPAQSAIRTSLAGEARKAMEEIVTIAERLDAVNFQKLVDAAHALDTKAKIEKFNRELNVAADKAARRRREASAPEYRVTIERTADDFFIIQLDAVRVFFNKQEMREITRHCHAAGSAADAARRLFRWFERERSDLLTDAGINSDRNPYLVDLYQTVVSTYKLKE